MRHDHQQSNMDHNRLAAEPSLNEKLEHSTLLSLSLPNGGSKVLGSWRRCIVVESRELFLHICRARKILPFPLCDAVTARDRPFRTTLPSLRQLTPVCCSSRIYSSHLSRLPDIVRTFVMFGNLRLSRSRDGLFSTVEKCGRGGTGWSPRRLTMRRQSKPFIEQKEHATSAHGMHHATPKASIHTTTEELFRKIKYPRILHEDVRPYCIYCSHHRVKNQPAHCDYHTYVLEIIHHDT